jgi:hypothetical protein
MTSKLTLLVLLLAFLCGTLPASGTNDPGTRVAPLNKTFDPYPAIVKGPPIPFSPTPLFESFESPTFPPAGWTKAQLTGGTGWNRQTVGTAPLPGWNGGVITAPPGGGNAVAHVTYIDGGTVSNDLWLITPQITNVQLNDSLYFWRQVPGYTNGYLDHLDIKISTTTNNPPGPFTINVASLFFPVNNTDTNWVRHGYRLGDFVLQGANIYIAFREWVNDNFNEGATILLDLVEVTSNPVGINNGNKVPLSYTLEQNYPNPFNPTTFISYSIPQPGTVKLILYDVQGKEVGVLLNEFKSAGSHTFRLDAGFLSSGVYFYKILSGRFTDTRRMILLK